MLTYQSFNCAHSHWEITQCLKTSLWSISLNGYSSVYILILIPAISNVLALISSAFIFGWCGQLRGHDFWNSESTESKSRDLVSTGRQRIRFSSWGQPWPHHMWACTLHFHCVHLSCWHRRHIGEASFLVVYWWLKDSDLNLSSPSKWKRDIFL